MLRDAERERDWDGRNIPWLPALLIILNIKLIQDCQYCFMVAAIVHPNGRSKIVAAFICIAAELLISCICALIN